jgi:hypothetical protein
MNLCPRHSVRNEQSAFDTVVVLVLERPGSRFLDAKDLVSPDDNPTAIFELDNHFLGEDFQSQHPALTMGGDHSRADGRQFVLESLVGVKLVS